MKQGQGRTEQAFILIGAYLLAQCFREFICLSDFTIYLLLETFLHVLLFGICCSRLVMGKPFIWNRGWRMNQSCCLFLDGLLPWSDNLLSESSFVRW